jgi:anion-transporting  ArsA/GET3 family ATPase
MDHSPSHLEQIPARSDTESELIDILRSVRLCVCCGAGGVGKTTTSAALALTGARLGLRVLALTIDPSKRLAQTLGVARNTPEPVELDRARLSALGVPEEGSLSAWLLDPKLVSDQVVHREAGQDAEALKQNPMYREISGMVAGMQEYTAVEALHSFLKSGAYDLIVLDTPPSRHALRFIDSPQRVAAFLDKRIFHLFVPSQTGLIGRVASRLVDEVLDRAFGEESRRELKQFFELFSRLLDHLNTNQKEMSTIFQSDDVRFFMVTTARLDAVDEAQIFAGETQRRGLHLGGFFLNRCPPSEVDADTTSTQDMLLSPSDEVTRDVDQMKIQLATRLESAHAALAEQGSATSELTSQITQLLSDRIHQQAQAVALRRETAQALRERGDLYRLKELTIDAASLEGISALADQLMGVKTR